MNAWTMTGDAPRWSGMCLSAGRMRLLQMLPERLLKTVRDQKLTSGQRVTVRLLEDYVEGNVRIPANTHLAAICKIGDRLELQIRSLEMSGRIVPLALDAYDTDGLTGIYCPETSSVKNTREVSRDVLTAGTTAFGGLVGDIANTVIRTGASIARNASGELSVSVVSGYEFYLVKSEKR